MRERQPVHLRIAVEGGYLTLIVTWADLLSIAHPSERRPHEY